MKASQNLVEPNAQVLLYLSRRKKWLVRASPQETMHTHVGFVELKALLGKEYGSSITTSLGSNLWILPPTVEDIVLKLQRKTQIVYPKDMGLIAIKAGVSPGGRIIEVGTGSGAMTILLASLVRPHGHVYSYELRPEFIELARKNLERCKLLQYVTVKERDAREGIDEQGADAAMIDIGDSWNAVKAVRAAIRGGAVIAAISPTFNQTEKLAAELSNGFIDAHTVEVLIRDMEVRAGMTRPSSRMIAHTAYLTFARKVLQEEAGNG